jgi:2'-hydroxyisoflavone reductase
MGFMKILILGGTRFLGRHLAEAARSAGHEVTLFNRGESAPPPPGMESLRGDRDGGLDALRGRSWDAVLDMSGYVPRVARASAELLHGNVGHYTFISSLSVLADSSVARQAEDAPVATMEDETVEEITGPTYGPLKALCEAAVRDVFGQHALIVRPGLIVGPYDTTDRFPYWPRRFARGGEVLAPGTPAAPVQFIDARDLASWALAMATEGTSGTFHATGPAAPLTLGEFLELCAETMGATANLTWVDDAFLLQNNVAPYSQMPLWIPAESHGFSMVDCRKAIAAGLEYRPLANTIRDTHAWDANRTDADRAGKGHKLIGASLAAAREQELLDAWRSRAAT